MTGHPGTNCGVRPPCSLGELTYGWGWGGEDRDYRQGPKEAGPPAHHSARTSKGSQGLRLEGEGVAFTKRSIKKGKARMGMDGYSSQTPTPCLLEDVTELFGAGELERRRASPACRVASYKGKEGKAFRGLSLRCLPLTVPACKEHFVGAVPSWPGVRADLNSEAPEPGCPSSEVPAVRGTWLAP